jgi:protein-S-isoprenylcysteine O-methyltransferase Ste14
MRKVMSHEDSGGNGRLSSKRFLIDDKDVDKALSLPFLALGFMSLAQSFIVAQPLLRIQLLFSVPLNLLAAYSFWVRRPALEPTDMCEVLVPTLTFLMPFLILNQGLIFGSPYSLPVLFPITLFGLVWAFISLFYLRRSFAVLPTVRGVVMDGPYKIVRHPLYLGETLYIFGAMMLGFSMISLILFALTLLLMKFRIDMEEKKMMTQADYQGYCLEVKYRLLPRIY